VDEAADAITTRDIAGWQGGERDRIDRVIGRSLGKALVRPGPVVVDDELD